MVRTKASVSTVRVSAAKAPRKYSAPASQSSISLSSPGGKKDKPIGGNTACPRPTPGWQKPIASFFTPVQRQLNKDEEEEGDRQPSTSIERVEAEVEEHFHDDKENRNPEAATVSAADVNDDVEEPGPSNRTAKNPKAKRRRVLMIESDSDGEGTTKMFGCVAEVDDVIKVT